MGEKKLSIKYLSRKTIKETFNMTKSLEKRIKIVMDKINAFKKRIHRKKQELKQGKLSSTRKKNFELNIIKLETNLEVLTDYKRIINETR